MAKRRAWDGVGVGGWEAADALIGERSSQLRFLFTNRPTNRSTNRWKNVQTVQTVEGDFCLISPDSKVFTVFPTVCGTVCRAASEQKP